MNTDRTFLLSIATVTASAAAIHILGAQPVFSWMWGAHFYAFFPTWLLYVATLTLVAVVLSLLFRGARLGEITQGSFSQRSSRSGMLEFVLGISLLFVMSLWIFRTTHTYLGDGNMLVQTLPLGQNFHERQPLTMWLQHAVYQGTHGWFESPERTAEDVAQLAVGVASALAGVVFVVVSWFLAVELTLLRRNRADKPASPAITAILWLILLLQGYIQLFFGYVENYTFLTATIAVFLWLCLRYLRGASPLFLPASVIVFGLALHLSTIVLIPAFVVLLAYGFARAERRVEAAVAFAMLAGGTFALHLTLGAVQDGYNFFATLREVTGLAVTRRYEIVEGYMFSSMHLRDFFNEQLLIGPLGLFLFIPALAVAAKKRTALTVFAAVCGLTYLAASWLAGDSNLGYARNWDLLAPGGLVFTVSGFALFMYGAVNDRLAAAALACALLLSAYHTIPWVATNANAERSLQRLKTLPLGFGRTDVLVAQWYRRTGDEANELKWLERAVTEHPRNNNGQYLLGLYHYKRRNFGPAATAFARAVAVRPDKIRYRRYLVEALQGANRLGEAIPHLKWLIDEEPGNISNYILYANALTEVNRRQEAVGVYEHALSLYKPLLDEQPDSHDANMGYGWILLNLERYGEALPYLEKALDIDPRSVEARRYVALTLEALGRGDEAARRFGE